MYLANNKWLKYVKMILVTAEEFGYGPIITAIYFLEQVNNYKHMWWRWNNKIFENKNSE